MTERLSYLQGAKRRYGQLALCSLYILTLCGFGLVSLLPFAAGETTTVTIPFRALVVVVALTVA